MRELTSRSSLMIEMKQVLSENSKFMVEEIHPITKHENKYLVVIRNLKRSLLSDIDIKNVKLTSANCKQLMIAATQLIKSLHSYGIRLYCSLWNFVQFEEGKSKRISAQMIKINQMEI